MKRYMPLLLLAIAAVQLGAAAFGHDVFAYRHDWNIPFFHSALVQMWHGTDGFTAWNSQQLGSPPFYPTLAPYLAIASTLATLGLSAAAIERLLLFSAFAIAGLGMYWLLAEMALPRIARLLGAAFYMLTPYIFNQVCTGVLADALAYAMMPVIAATFCRGVVASSRPSRLFLLVCSGALWGLTSFHPVYLALNAFSLLVLACASGAYLPFLVAFGAALCIDAYFILPLLSSATSMGREFLAAAPRRVVFDLSPSFSEVVRLTGFKGYFAESVVRPRHEWGVWAASGFAAFCISVAALFARVTRASRTLAVALLAALLLATGTTYFGDAYYWLVSHLPGGAAFRESYRFVAVAAFFEAVGLAVSYVVVARRFPSALRTYAVAAFSLVALSGLPFWQNGLVTQLPRAAVPAVAGENFERLRAARGNARMLYVPFLIPISAGTSIFAGIDPMVSWPPRDTFGNYLPFPILRAVASSLYHGETANSAMLLRWTNVGFVDRRYWLTGRFGEFSGAQLVPEDAQRFSDDALERSLRDVGLKQLAGSSLDRVWSIPFHEQNRVLPLDRLNVATGSLAHAAVLGRDDSAVVYLDQVENINDFFARYPKSASPALTVVDGQYVNVVADFVPRRYHRQPGLNAPEIDANAGWSSFGGAWSSWWWYRSSYAQSLGDVALAGPLAHSELDVDFAGMPLGPARLLVRAFSGPHNGELLVDWPGGSTVLTTRSATPSRDGRWFDLGWVDLKDVSWQVTLSNVSGENAVSDVVLAPIEEYYRAQVAATALFQRAAVGNLLTVPGSRVPITITRGGRYLVSVQFERPVVRAQRVGVTIGERTLMLTVERGRDFSQQPAIVTAGMLGARFGPRTLPASVLIAPAQALTDAGAQLRRTSEYSYLAIAKGPAVVELDNNFAPGWRIEPDAPHVVLNGFANGWIVPSAGTYRIWYAPYGMAILGRLVSLAGGLALVLLGAVGWRLSRRAPGR